MRLSIQRKLREGEKEEVCADDAQAEGDLSLYDSTDEYGDEEIKNMRWQKIDAEDEAEGWVFLWRNVAEFVLG